MEQKSLEEQYAYKSRTYKLLLLFGMISIIMIFAGLTSAFVVSKERPDWLRNLQLPFSFTLSTIILIGSSFTFYLSKKSIRSGKLSISRIYLLATLGLGLIFIYLQFHGFHELFKQGLVPTGKSGKVTVSFLYAFVVVHVAHLVGGIISLLYVIYNHYKQKYNSSQHLGIELSEMYWHFMDLVWIYLFLFFTFFK